MSDLSLHLSLAGRNKHLLDRVSGAEVAYALHRLRRGYSGAAIRVRRDSDNAETDVNFVGNRVTLNSPVSAGGSFGDWVGANSALVAKWYDQSGNANDATQTTAGNQPRIVNAGTLDVDANGNAEIIFNGSNNRLEADAVATVFSGTDLPLSTLCVFRQGDGSNEYPYVFGNSGDSNPVLAPPRASSGSLQYLRRDDAAVTKSPGGSALGTSTRLVSTFSAGTSVDAYIDGSIDIDGGDIDVGAITLDRFTIGALRWNISPVGHLNGAMQALVLYAADKGSRRSIAEQGLNRILEIF